MAGSLGYCGLDRRRQPLVGDEIRSCWEAWPGAVDLPLTIPPVHISAEPREFVEVGARSAGENRAAATGESPPAVAASPPSAIPTIDEPGWSLWGDVEG